jgi:WD40 repeat protein
MTAPWCSATAAVRRSTGRTGPVFSVAIAADGTWLATAGNDGTVRICDRATGTWVASMRVDGIVHGVAWTPDGGGSRGVYLFGYVRGDNARHLT